MAISGRIFRHLPKEKPSWIKGWKLPEEFSHADTSNITTRKSVFLPE
jgi:hypothetical protein